MFGKKRRPSKGPAPATLDWREIRKFCAAGDRGGFMVEPGVPRTCPGSTVVFATTDRGTLPKWEVTAFVDQQVDGEPAEGAFGLFTDPDHLRPICRALEPEAADDGSLTYTAVDDRGSTLGTVTRVPASHRRLKHTWRIDAPDGAVVEGRNVWAARGLLTRGLGDRLPLGHLVGASNPGRDNWTRGRSLDWTIAAPEDTGRQADTLLMSSTSADLAYLTERGADVLDRRLAMLAVIAEGRSLRHR